MSEETNGQNGQKDQSRDEFTAERYPALQTLSGVYLVLAWLAGISAIIFIIYGLSMLNNFRTKSEGIDLIIQGLIYGVLGVIFCLAISQGIKLFVDLERNTRKQNQLLTKLLEKNNKNGFLRGVGEANRD